MNKKPASAKYRRSVAWQLTPAGVLLLVAGLAHVWLSGSLVASLVAAFALGLLINDVADLAVDSVDIQGADVVVTRRRLVSIERRHWRVVPGTAEVHTWPATLGLLKMVSFGTTDGAGYRTFWGLAGAELLAEQIGTKAHHGKVDQSD